MYCPKCGKETTANARFCARCGYGFKEQSETGFAEESLQNSSNPNKNPKKKYRLLIGSTLVISLLVVITVAIVVWFNEGTATSNDESEINERSDETYIDYDEESLSVEETIEVTITVMVSITENDNSASELSGVTITVADADGNIVETIDTSELSGYTFTLPIGTYTITAEADGYETVSKEVTLSENDVMDIDFEMQPSSKTEDELHAIFSDAISQDNEIYFFYDDFDNNGEYEAFGITGTADELGGYNNVLIYYVSSDGDCICLNGNSQQELYGYLTIGGLLSVDDYKFLLWERSAGGSGSVTFIYGVKAGSAYELEISGEYMLFGTSLDSDSNQPEGSVVGFISDFSKGYHDYVPVYFTYDANLGEFVEFE